MTGSFTPSAPLVARNMCCAISAPTPIASPLRNSCLARRLNQTGTPHESLSTSSAPDRASARSRTPCLLRSKPLRGQPLHRPHQVSASPHAAPSCPSVIGRCPTLFVPDPSAPDQTDSTYIGFHEGGFLQVAVSEAPHLDTIDPTRNVLSGGAPDTALRLFVIYPIPIGFRTLRRPDRISRISKRD
jgi:hypothetical protein